MLYGQVGNAPISRRTRMMSKIVRINNIYVFGRVSGCGNVGGTTICVTGTNDMNDEIRMPKH